MFRPINQMPVYHKDYPDRLTVVVLVKTHRVTGKRGHVILFSIDLNLSANASSTIVRIARFANPSTISWIRFAMHSTA